MRGRQAELSNVTELLSRHRVVTITGPAGVGKSTLAHAATDLDTRDHVLADVASLRGHDLRDEVAGSLGFPTWQSLLSGSGRGPVIVVFDDCERHVADIAEIVTELMGARPDVTVLATSREALDIPGERVFVLPPLSLDGHPSEAAQLFVALTAARGLPPPERLDDVEALCRSLDGLPLAIELAAGRSAVLTPTEIRTSVEIRLDLLSRSRPRAADRRSSLDAAIGWSIDLLDEPTRSMLEAVSVCDGAFTLELASRVAGLPSPASALPLLEALVAQSLVIHDPASDTSWFRLLNTIRTHARERLAAVGLLDRTRERFADAMADLCDHLSAPAVHMQDPQTPDEVSRSYPNIAAAVSWCIEHDATSARVNRMMMPLFWLEDVGNQAEAADLVGLVLTRWPDAGSMAWGTLANLNRVANRIGQAREAALRALDGAPGFGIVLAHRALGLLDRESGRPEPAIEHFRAGAAAAQDAGLAAHALELEAHGAVAMHAMGDTEAAIELLTDLDERTDQYPLCQRCVRLFAGHILVRVDPARVATTSATYLADAHRHGHTWAAGAAAYQVGLACLLTGDVPAAADHAAHAVEAFDSANELADLRSAILLSAGVLVRLGAADDAARARGLAGRLPARELSESDRDLLIRAGIEPDDLPPLVDEHTPAEVCRALRRFHAGAVLADQLPQHQAAEPENVFVRQGDAWKVGYSGRSAFARHTKGMSDLATLLSRPRREVSALDLIGAVAVSGDSGTALDNRARMEYQERIRELQAQITEAEHANDPYRAEQATLELDAIVDELSSAYGLGGRPRGQGSTAERARTAVTWRIRAAIDRLRDVHPELADHLRRSVRTGRFCCYDPPIDITWKL